MLLMLDRLYVIALSVSELSDAELSDTRYVVIQNWAYSSSFGYSAYTYPSWICSGVEKASTFVQSMDVPISAGGCRHRDWAASCIKATENAYADFRDNLQLEAGLLYQLVLIWNFSLE